MASTVGSNAKVHEEPWMVGVGDAQTIFVEGFAAWAESRV
jgi:hypothetical protein